VCTSKADREIALQKPGRVQTAPTTGVSVTPLVRPGAVGCKIMLDLSPQGISDKAERFRFEPWQLRTPLTKYSLAGMPYGLDNGCFSGRLPDAWPRMLAEAKKTPPLWATSPDVVGSARRTLELWPHFARAMNGLPRALVLQDGIADIAIPWHEVACVFIGGSDAFKVSAEARAAATAARMLGKWVHVGRVNTAERALAWKDIADSIDGSGISRYDHMLAAVLSGLRGELPQMDLFSSAA